ncbi:MAG: substrate-binding domain-containing protein [Rubrivivax sp.]
MRPRRTSRPCRTPAARNCASRSWPRRRCGEAPGRAPPPARRAGRHHRRRRTPRRRVRHDGVARAEWRGARECRGARARAAGGPGARLPPQPGGAPPRQRRRASARLHLREPQPGVPQRAAGGRARCERRAGPAAGAGAGRRERRAAPRARRIAGRWRGCLPAAARGLRRSAAAGAAAPRGGSLGGPLARRAGRAPGERVGRRPRGRAQPDRAPPSARTPAHRLHRRRSRVSRRHRPLQRLPARAGRGGPRARAHGAGPLLLPVRVRRHDGCSRSARAAPRCSPARRRLAAGAIAAAARAGLGVPRELSIVGFDDTPIAATVSPAITTMRQPIADMARTAVRLLRRQGAAGAATGATPERTTFHCTLVERDSCAPPHQGGSMRPATPRRPGHPRRPNPSRR